MALAEMYRVRCLHGILIQSSCRTETPLPAIARPGGQIGTPSEAGLPVANDSISAVARAQRDRYVLERELGRSGMAVVYRRQAGKGTAAQR